MPPTIKIEYAALPHRGGFIPVYREQGGPWAWIRRTPVSREQAIAEAASVAQDEASRYVGDWDVSASEVTVAALRAA